MLSEQLKPMSLAILACILFFGTTVQAKAPSDVVVLDPKNFDRIVGSGVTFVKFYAPWCGHCKKVAPVWEEVATELKGKGVRVAKCDANEHASIGDDHDISAFPTFKIYVDGKLHSTYRGNYDRPSFVSFAVGVATRPKLPAFPKNKEEAIVFYQFLNSSITAWATERLLLFSMVIFTIGSMFGMCCGVLVAIREKSKLD